jgi:hypothetical protein
MRLRWDSPLLRSEMIPLGARKAEARALTDRGKEADGRDDTAVGGMSKMIPLGGPMGAAHP